MNPRFCFVLLPWMLLTGASWSTGQDRNKDATVSVEAAIRVNHVLDQYLAVEEDLFKPSIRRVAPVPGVFEKMDFPGFSKKLRSLGQELEKTLTSMKSQQPKRAEVREFNSALSDYARMLRASIGALDVIVVKLEAKAQDPEKYDFDEYKRDLDRYAKLKEDCSAAGAKLNGLFRKIQE